MCVVLVRLEKARENTTWEAVFGVQIIHKEAWEIVLSHHISNIWIDMETSQHFNKQLGTLLHPSWLQASPPHPHRWLMSEAWAWWQPLSLLSQTPFSSFLLHKGKKIGEGQWEGVIVLSNASLRKSSFSAGNGELKCQSRALWKYSPWTCRGVEADVADASTSFPSSLPCPGLSLFSSPAQPQSCIPRPHSDLHLQLEEKEAGLQEDGGEGQPCHHGLVHAGLALRSPAGLHSSYTMHACYSCL